MTISNQDKRVAHTGLDGVTTYNFNFPIFESSDLKVVMRNVTTGVEETLVLDTDYTVAFTPGSPGGITVSKFPRTGHTIMIILDPDVVQETSLTSAGPFPSAEVETGLDKLLNLVKRAHDQSERSLRLTDGSLTGLTDTHGNWDALEAPIKNVAAPTDDDDAATKASVAAAIAAALIDPTTVISPFAATMLDDLSGDAVLATLGGAANGIALLKNATAADSLTDLSFSAYMQTLVGAASAAALRTLVEVPKWDELTIPNLLVNPDFQVWQNGPTFNSTTPAAGGNNDNVYTADQWVLLSNGNNIASITKGSTPPAGARGVLKATVVAADTKFGLLQIVESQKCVPLRGKAVSIAIDVKATGSLTVLQMQLISWAGTADAPTRDVVSAWNLATASPTLVANWTSLGTAPVVGSASWATATLENVTIPAGCNNLGILITTSDLSFGVGAEVDFSAAMLVESSRALKFRSRSIAEEIIECERFFQKTFPLETAPASAAGMPGALVAMATANGASPSLDHYWNFRTRMWKTPNPTTYNPEAAGSGWDQIGGALTFAATVHTSGPTGTHIYGANAGMTNQQLYGVHATADARF